MKLIISDAEFWMAHFRFTPPTQEKVIEKMSGTITVATNRGRSCYCTLHKGPCKNQARPCDTPGSTTCWVTLYHRDHFDRYVGRKQAFTRAVATVDSKPTREALWRAYLVASPPPIKNVIVKGKKHVGNIPRSKAHTPESICPPVLALPANVGTTTTAAARASTGGPMAQADGSG